MAPRVFYSWLVAAIQQHPCRIFAVLTSWCEFRLTEVVDNKEIKSTALPLVITLSQSNQPAICSFLRQIAD
jgi:hypothetical protein